MWKKEQDYVRTFEAVKAIRGVANPNLGFVCQVLHIPDFPAILLHPQNRSCFHFLNYPLYMHCDALLGQKF